jgi:inner membrane protein
MDPLTQGTLGSALAQTASDSRRIRGYAIAGGVSGLVPDLDIFIRSSTDPLLYLEFHRQFTHSLVFIPIGAGLCALLLHHFIRKTLSWKEIYLACLLGYATHGLLDACTSYGTQLFWPFSDYRVSWNWVSVIDPLFSVPLFGCVVLGYLRRSRSYALVGMCWAVLYMLIGVIQHERSLSAADALAAERGHVPVRVATKPGFANLLLWKSVYEHDGRYYVDGIRMAAAPLICDGESIGKLVREVQLPWLEPESQQGRDVERFRWYSDGWLAIDREEPLYVVDVRYSSLPNRIDALWGLLLDEGAEQETHATYHVVRSRRTESLTSLLDLLAGRGCRALRATNQ